MLLIALSLFFVAAAIGCIVFIGKGIFALARWIFSSIPDIAKSGYYFGKVAAKVVLIIIATIVAIAVTCALFVVLVIMLFIII